MPKESQLVNIRTSASADGWWSKMANAKVNESFRVLDDQQLLLFNDNSWMHDLPYRRQILPPHLNTLTFPAPSPPPLSSGSFSLPEEVVSSTEIKLRVMAKELKDMEDVQDQHCKEMAALRKKVSGVFKVNRALAAFQAENF